ncbi:MAG: choice-of-anchor D domain-containing protein, partial [Pirellulales bacterium]|nr:choice-of-anchor D domain-containing protein [Pirellulales bacterium]
MGCELLEERALLAVVTIQATDNMATETPGDVGVFTISRNAPGPSPLTVYLSIGGSAGNGTDYQQVSNSVVIPANQTSAQITITPVDDAFEEGNETVVISIMTSMFYTVGSPSSATVTIVDNDNLPSVWVSVSDGTAHEEDTSPGTFTIHRDGSTSSSLTVYFSLGGTATSADYSSPSGTSVVIPAGASSATVTVVPVDDTLSEGDETVQLVLVHSSPQTYQLGSNASGTLTIVDNDPPTVSVQAIDAQAAEQGPDTATFRFTRLGASSTQLVINYSLSGTATVGDDYQHPAGSVTLMPGVTTLDLQIEPWDDAEQEEVETIVLTITPHAAYLVDSEAASATAYVEDNDVPRVSVQAIDSSALEGNPPVPAKVRFRREGLTSAALTVNYTVGGTASGADYQPLPGVIEIPAGATSVDLLIEPVDDALPENSETVVIALASSAAYAIDPMQDQAVVTITSDDPPQVWLELLDSAAAESAQHPAAIRVWRNGPLLYELTVLYTYSGTATAEDFTSLPGYLTIPAGESSVLLVLTPVDDDLPEWPETLIVTLADAAAYNPAEPVSAAITIADNDPPWVYVVADDPSARENDPADSARLVFTRLGPDDMDLTVYFAVIAGTAEAADFQPLPASIVIPAGQSTAEVLVTPVDDELAEIPETLIIALLEDPAYRRYQPWQASLTLIDDENQPPTAADDYHGGVVGFGIYVPAPGVLYNDRDPDGHPLIALLEEGPQHGTLELLPDGSFTYTPAAGYVGEDSFTYRASDTGLASEPATVFLVIYPHAPNLRLRYGQQEVAHGITALDLGGTTVGYPRDYTFHLRNDGTEDLLLDLPSWSLPAGFVVHTEPDASLAPGRSTRFVLRLAAEALGTYGGTVALASNDPDEDPFEFEISAQVWPASPHILLAVDGVALASGTSTVDFGTANLNFPVWRTFVLQNAGTAELEIDPQQMLLPDGFSLLAAPPPLLGIGQQAEFVVQFDAATLGTASGTFALPSNALANNPFTLAFTATAVTAPEIEITVEGQPLLHASGTLDFGQVPVGTTAQRTLTISNIGSAALVLAFSPVVPPGFLIDWTEGDLAIEPGQSHQVTISLAGIVPGSFGGQVALFNNDRDEQPFSFDVAATVVAPAVSLWHGEMPVERSQLVDLGHTPLAEPLEASFTLANLGQAPLLLETPILPPGWQLAAAPEPVVAPGGSTSFTIRLAAEVPGRYAGHVVLPNNDPWAGLFIFGVTAAVGLSEIRATLGPDPLSEGARLSFGNTPQHTPVDRLIAITNAGSADLMLGQEILLPAGFTLLAGPQTYTLAPGESTAITVRLAAEAAGVYAGKLRLVTNDERHRSFELALDGKAALPELRLLLGSEPLAPGSQVELGLTLPGTPRRQTLTIHNAGTADLELGELLLPEGFTLLTAPQALVPPGQSTSLEIELAAEVPGRFVGTAVLRSNDPELAELSWQLAGSVAAISQIRLWNDTGVSSHDLATSDPSLAIAVAGLAENATGWREAIEVQLDVDADGEPDAAYLARAGLPMVAVPPGLLPGVLTVSARLRIAAAEPQQDLLGPWIGFSFTLQTGTNASPVVTQLALANDTGSSSTDRQTSDPTITGLLVNDGNVAYVTIELDLDGDGLADQAGTTDAHGGFAIKPVGLALGEVQVKLRAVEPDYPRGMILGPWVAFAFTLVEPGPPRIVSLGLARDTGESDTDLVTYDPTLTGTVVAEGSPRHVLVELDLNDDGAGDLASLVDEAGRFTLELHGAHARRLQPGSITVHVRAVAHDRGPAGDWLPFSFTLYEKPGPAIVGLALLRDTGASHTDGITSDPTLSGSVAFGEGAAFATVQFDYTGDGEPDASTVADEQGRFEYAPANLEYGEHTVRVRASAFDTELGRQRAGAWVSITFTYQQPAALVVEWLALLNDTGESQTDRITSDPTIHGQLGGESIVALQQVEIDLNADGRPDDTTTSDEQGRFLYQPRGLPGGSATVAARGVHWDSLHQTYVYGAWVSLSFTYQPAIELGGPEFPGLAEGTAEGGQTAAAALAAVRAAIGTALASHAAAAGLDAPPGSVNLGLFRYHTLTDAAFGRNPQRGQYGFEEGSLPAQQDWQAFFTFHPTPALFPLDLEHEQELDVAEGGPQQGSLTSGTLLSTLQIARSGGESGTFTIELAISLAFDRGEHGLRSLSTHGGDAPQDFLLAAAGSYSLLISVAGSYQPGQAEEVLYSGTITVSESLAFTFASHASAPYSGTVGGRTAQGANTHTAGGSAAFIRQISAGSFSTSTLAAHAAQIDYATQQTFSQSYTLYDAGDYYPAGSGSSGSYVHARSYSVAASSTDAGTLSIDAAGPAAVGAFARDESTSYSFTLIESRTHALSHPGGSIVHSFASSAAGGMSFSRQEMGTYFVSPSSYVANVTFTVSEIGGTTSSGDTLAAYAYVYQGVNVADSTHWQTSSSMDFTYSELGNYTLADGTSLVSGSGFSSHASFAHSETVQQTGSRLGPNFQGTLLNTRTTDSTLTQSSAGTGFTIGPQGTSASGSTTLAYSSTGGYTLLFSGSGSDAASSYAFTHWQAGTYSSQFDSTGIFVQSPATSSASSSYTSTNDFAYDYTVDLSGSRSTALGSASFSRFESGSAAGSYSDSGNYQRIGDAVSVSGSYQFDLAGQSQLHLQTTGQYHWAAGQGAVSGTYTLLVSTSGTRSETQSGSYTDDSTSGSFSSHTTSHGSQQLVLSGSHSSPWIGSTYTYQETTHTASDATHSGSFSRGPSGDTTSGAIHRNSSGTTDSSGQGTQYHNYSYPTGSASGRASGNWSQQVAWSEQDSSSYTTTPTSHSLSGNYARSRDTTYFETSTGSGSHASPVLMVLGVPTGTSGTYHEQRIRFGTTSSQESAAYSDPRTAAYAATGTFQSSRSETVFSSSSAQHHYVELAASGTSTLVQQNASQHAYSETGTFTANAAGITRTADYTSQGSGTAVATAANAGHYGRHAPGGVNGGHYASWQTTNSRSQHSETGTYTTGPSGIYRSNSFQSSSASNSQATSSDNPTFGSTQFVPGLGSRVTSGSASHQSQTQTARTARQSGTSEWLADTPLQQSVSFETTENIATTASGQASVGTLHLNSPFYTTVSGSQSSYHTQTRLTFSEQGSFWQQGTAAPTRAGTFSRAAWQQVSHAGQGFLIHVDREYTTTQGETSSAARHYAYAEATSYLDDTHTGRYQESEITSAQSDSTLRVQSHPNAPPGTPHHTAVQQLHAQSTSSSFAQGTFTRARGLLVASTQHYLSLQDTVLSTDFTAHTSTSKVDPDWRPPAEPQMRQPASSDWTSDFWENPQAEQFERMMDGTAGKPAPYQGTPYDPAGADQTLTWTHDVDSRSNSTSHFFVFGYHAHSPSGSDYWSVSLLSEHEQETSTETEKLAAQYDLPTRRGLFAEAITYESSYQGDDWSFTTTTGGTTTSPLHAWSTTQETYRQSFSSSSTVTSSTKLFAWLDDGYNHHTHQRQHTVSEYTSFSGRYAGHATEQMELQGSGTPTFTPGGSHSSQEIESGGKTETLSYTAGFGQLGSPSFGGSGSSGGSGGGSSGGSPVPAPDELLWRLWVLGGNIGWAVVDMAANTLPLTFTGGFDVADLLGESGQAWLQTSPAHGGSGSANSGNTSDIQNFIQGALDLLVIFQTTFDFGPAALRETYSSQRTTSHKYVDTTHGTQRSYQVDKQSLYKVDHTQAYQLDARYDWVHQETRDRTYTDVGDYSGNPKRGTETLTTRLDTFTLHTRTAHGTTTTLSQNGPHSYSHTKSVSYDTQPVGWDEAPEPETPPEEESSPKNKLLDAIQTVLDVIGIFDPTGISDLVNAGISFARGNYEDGVMNLVSAVPLVGDVIGKGAKLVSKAGKAMKAAGKASDSLGGVGKLASNVGEVLGKAADRTCAVATPLLRGLQIAGGIETVGMGVGQIRDGNYLGGALTILDGLAAMASARHTTVCFTAGHQVLVSMETCGGEEGSAEACGAGEGENQQAGVVVIDRDEILAGPGASRKVGTARGTTHDGPLHPAGGGLLAAALESWGLADLGLVLDPAAWSLENRAAATVLLVGAGLAAHRLLDSRRRKLRPHLAHALPGGQACHLPGEPEALPGGQASRLPGASLPAGSRRPTREE